MRVVAGHGRSWSVRGDGQLDGQCSKYKKLEDPPWVPSASLLTGFFFENSALIVLLPFSSLRLQRTRSTRISKRTLVQHLLQPSRLRHQILNMSQDQKIIPTADGGSVKVGEVTTSVKQVRLWTPPPCGEPEKGSADGQRGCRCCEDRPRLPVPGKGADAEAWSKFVLSWGVRHPSDEFGSPGWWHGGMCGLCDAVFAEEAGERSKGWEYLTREQIAR